MADINVERKGPSIWPWIIGLIVLALLIWALVEMFGDRTQPVTGTAADTVWVDTPTVAPAAPGAPADTPGPVMPADPAATPPTAP